MPLRTSPKDLARVEVASDLDDIVLDKREGWRASDAKARRRQRRCKQLLTRQLIKAARRWRWWPLRRGLRSVGRQ
jgi:hypothetical protein